MIQTDQWSQGFSDARPIHQPLGLQSFYVTLTNNIIQPPQVATNISQYLQCPIHEQFDPEKQKQRDLLMDGTGHTSHSDCVLLKHWKETNAS